MPIVVRVLSSIALIAILGGCAGAPVAPASSSGESGSADAGASVTAAGPTEASYRMGEGDRIAIQVFDEPDLTMNASVGSSGVINYSYLGNVQVAGKTPVELERELTRLLQDGFLVNPAVNVTVVDYRPFFINGEVENPGGYPFQPGLTLDKAVALAGGLTDRASTRRMYVTTPEARGGKGRRVSMSYRIAPGEIVTIDEGFF